MSDQYIMYKDTPVMHMYVKNNICKFRILDLERAPLIFLDHSVSVDRAWKSFLQNRIPILTQENYETVNRYIYEHYGQSIEYLRNSGVTEKDIKGFIYLRVSSAFHGISMTDSFWLKTDRDDLVWDDINPRKHELKDICSIPELKSSLKLQQEYSGIHELYDEKLNGATPKMWRVCESKVSELYKRGGTQETRNEVIVSQILDHTNVPHVSYEMVSEMSCKCRNIANDDISVVNGDDIYHYCTKQGITFGDFMKNLNPDLYNAMQVIDFLIDNPDRSIHNQGCLRDNESGRIIDIQPLFDHNNAFDERLMAQDRDSDEYRRRLTHAKLCLSECNFRMEQIPFSVFQDYEKYKSFMEKACDLGICRKELRKGTFIEKLFSKKKVYTVNGDYTDIHNETMEKYMEYDTMEENRTEPDDDFVDYLHQCEMEAVNLNENQIIYEKELEEDIER